MKKYDYIIVGAGLFGAVFAHMMTRRKKKCLVLERRAVPGGNIRCEEREGIQIHKYGAHIFHTNDEEVWQFVNQFAAFNHYVNSPLANYEGEIYNLPFNMNTFHALWGVVTPQEAKAKIASMRGEMQNEPQNLEEQAIKLVGRDIYEKLIKGYTEKQWGRSCRELPAFIIRRLPLRFTYDNNYFNARRQGIPIGGYNKIIDALLAGADIECGADFNSAADEYKSMAKKIVYTGALDEYFGFEYGRLEYRSLRFETERLDEENYQGVAVMNFTSAAVPYTRIIEHKHFEFGNQNFTYITREYPAKCESGDEAFYPVNDERNQKIYARYAEAAAKEKNLIVGGRLAAYKYYDMDATVAAALRMAKDEAS